MDFESPIFVLDRAFSFTYNGFKMIDNKAKKELLKKLGKGKVYDQDEYLLTYSYDATGDAYAQIPDLVVFPECEEDIQHILKTSHKYKIPVTPRGAGVGYSGGSVPVKGGMVMAFTRMNKILEINSTNFVADIEPGVVTYDLQREVEKKGLFYPADPASLKTSTIGGNVAENAGGPRCFKYGVTENYVMRLEAFLMNGDKICTGSYALKNVAGYNLKSLLTGSEGTLAVIAKISLKLIPLPELRIFFRLDFRSLKAAADFINSVIRANINPSVLEFMDKSSISAVCRYLDDQIPPQTEASVLMELDGNNDDVRARKDKLLKLIKESGQLEYKIARTEKQQESLWHLRRNISPAIARLRPKKINEDIVVPIDKIPGTVEYINNLAQEYHLVIVLFGHIGDGNIHTNLMVDPQNNDEMQRSEIVLHKIFQYVVEQKGSITGEHGVGLTKKNFLPYQFKDHEIELFRKIKRVFDPDNLLNPGKIF